MKMPFDDAIAKLAPTDDVVNKPNHYMVAGIEVRDIQRELSADMTGMQASDFNNAVKYLLRSPKKGKLRQDLMKCHRHITWLIESLEQ
jgi:DNA-directed RNA polymerase specialized sigma54-like protein